MKLLGRRGLTRTRLLLTLATTKGSTLRGCTSTRTTAAATSTTAAAASTTAAAASTTSIAATEAPTPSTTPTSTATPSASSTTSTAAPTVPSTTLAPLALAVAVPPTRSRRSTNLLSANEVDSSSKSNRGEKGDRGTPLKERGAAVAGGAFCRAEGIRQTFTLPASPQQNGIAECRIGMYAAHQINLQPRVSLPETTPTLRWTGKVGDASAFRVWGSRAFVRDTSADKLSSRAVPCVFLGFPPDALGWQFYHPTSRRVLSSQDVTFDESVSHYHPAEPVEVAVDSGAARGAEPAGAGTRGAALGVSVSESAEPGGAEPERVEPGGAEPGGAESGSAELGGAEPKRVEPGGGEPGGTASGGTEPERAESGGPPSVSSRWEPLSPQQLREWYARRCCGAAGAGGAAGGAAGAGAAGGATIAGAAGGASGAAGGATGAGAAGSAAGVGAAGGAGAAGPGGGRTRGIGAAGANV
ncbi:unnamed protein product [Closterium sp. NIES-53]